MQKIDKIFFRQNGKSIYKTNHVTFLLFLRITKKDVRTKIFSQKNFFSKKIFVLLWLKFYTNVS